MTESVTASIQDLAISESPATLDAKPDSLAKPEAMSKRKYHEAFEESPTKENTNE